MTSRQLVDFVEGKLKQHGIRKVIPDAEDLSENLSRCLPRATDYRRRSRR